MKIESMQWLSGLEHHKVGHVHDIIDAADTNFLEGAAQPIRAGPNSDAANDAGRVAGTKVGVLNANRHERLC